MALWKEKSPKPGDARKERGPTHTAKVRSAGRLSGDKPQQDRLPWMVELGW